MKVYQFDGHFVHGCDVCASSTTRWRKFFAHGQTHEEVRAKTIRRDGIFREWASSLNSSSSSSVVEYAVISDCHSPGYSPWSLDKAFQTDPVLAQLVTCYQTVGRLERRKQGGRKRKREEEEEEEESRGRRRQRRILSLSEVTLESWLNFMKKEEENNSFTCIAWVKGFFLIRRRLPAAAVAACRPAHWPNPSC